MIKRSAVGHSHRAINLLKQGVKDTTSETLRPVAPGCIANREPQGRPGRRTKPADENVNLTEMLRRSLEKKK